MVEQNNASLDKKGVFRTASVKSLPKSVCALGQLGFSHTRVKKLESVVEIFPMRIPSHLLSYVKLNGANGPIGRQLLPDVKELDLLSGKPDPLMEESFQVENGVIQRFRDRLLALVSADCPLHCRHCNRKRYWTKQAPIASPEAIARVLQKKKGTIKEVILSGGEPLLLSNQRLDELLKAARSVNSVELVRIHTRIPFSLPSRITNSLLQLMKKHKPLWILTQFNHSKELITPTIKALRKIVDSGIPLLNQAVLLKGVNDTVQAQAQLGRMLVVNRVKPHYLFQLDRVAGSTHFQVSYHKAREIISCLSRNHSSLIVPRLVIDLPGKIGKVPIAGADVRLTKNGVYVNSPGRRQIYYRNNCNN